MNESEQRAALKQLEDKLARQEHAVRATNAMIDLIKSIKVDKPTQSR